MSRLGMADLGLATLNDMRDNAGMIASLDRSIPVIADADTGYGGMCFSSPSLIKQYPPNMQICIDGYNCSPNSRPTSSRPYRIPIHIRRHRRSPPRRPSPQQTLRPPLQQTTRPRRNLPRTHPRRRQRPAAIPRRHCHHRPHRRPRLPRLPNRHRAAEKSHRHRRRRRLPRRPDLPNRRRERMQGIGAHARVAQYGARRCDADVQRRRGKADGLPHRDFPFVGTESGLQERVDGV